MDPLCPPELQVLEELHGWSSINHVLGCSEGCWWFDELGESSAFLFLHLFEGSSGFLPFLPPLFPLVLMGCLWFWSWKHFLVRSAWFVAVVILQWFPTANSEVLSPSLALALLFWGSSCFSSISVEELHAHCWAACSFPSFRTVHFYKDPFCFGSWLLSKTFLLLHLAKCGKALPASMVLTQVLPWPRAEHPSVSRVCC